MKKISRRGALKLIGLGGIAAASRLLYKKAQASESSPSTTSTKEISPVLNITLLPASGPWPTKDPFIFCVHHNDVYPTANDKFGPKASLYGRNLGQDFSNKDGWNMYHGMEIPGFPRHPHRGFETVTIVQKGLIDHSDSLGSAARYGNGDVQWLTAGDGIMHSEMFPLLNKLGQNPIDFFQIWVNLPAVHKRVKPYFSMFWINQIPIVCSQDTKGRTTEVTVVAGSYGKNKPPSPPPDSWASETDSDIAMWIIKLNPMAEWDIPTTAESTLRSLYVVRGSGIKIGSELIRAGHLIELNPSMNIHIAEQGQGTELLLLQGKPISEPVVKHGPFVMTSNAEIKEAYTDYQRTQFGNWKWDRDDPVHGGDNQRFANMIDGSKETPE